ncbi:biotin--[acetyl-CoA-carboxylase] ligase [Paenibacillus albiflavus]|uniref:Bifunctional ligase/repressor BirA n=1 Tax=Paenibacillus albiflavus TaxID=2545760 RepID=A0A4R4ELP1_9BACL|nr:biotin--[acetyl-CoA-carboxylase] ligase [Paenibacillus albiflavus]TCZ81184.1 biotin--[acetyl-CoA-carboxylase] ligase [Paenibacillus albiflavus]
MNENYQRILQVFQEQGDAFLSGEQLSQQLGVSRTAVWKQIENLRAEGYVFEAVSRKGYRLVQSPVKLDIARLMALLETRTFGRSIHYYDEVSSTNTIAHDKVAQGAEEGTLIIAECQTSGRGRLGRSWFSPKGKGIWMSLVLKPKIPLFFTPQLTLLTAVAACRSIRRVCAVDVKIKWPNDLLISGKKVTGILLETSAEDERMKYTVCGIGISVNLKPDDYPKELKQIATSLGIEAGHEIERETIIAAFLKEFEDLCELYYSQGFGPIRILWEALAVSIGQVVRAHTSQGIIEGKAIALDDSGALVILQNNGEETKVYSGEIKLN